MTKEFGNLSVMKRKFTTFALLLLFISACASQYDNATVDEENERIINVSTVAPRDIDLSTAGSTILNSDIPTTIEVIVGTASLNIETVTVNPSTTEISSTNATDTTTSSPITTPNTTSISPDTTTVTVTPNTTTMAPISTTEIPNTKPRRFDGASFIGGMVLAIGLMCIGLVAWKFYRARTERNYHTL